MFRQGTLTQERLGGYCNKRSWIIISLASDTDSLGQRSSPRSSLSLSLTLIIQPVAMAQWGQGYQYPMQTGFNPQQQQQQFQQQGFPQGGIAPQPTGFPGQQQRLQPQPTGFPGGAGFQQPQQTGFQPGLVPQQTGFPGGNFQQGGIPPVPPVPPIPTQFQQQQQVPNVTGGNFLGAQAQPNRFLSPSPGPLTAQPTGMGGMGGLGGGMRPLVPQVTGFVDPRLQMMTSTLLPANPSMPYNPAGAPQFQQQQNLQQSFLQHNQAQRGTAAPKIPWTLSKAEKKMYDQVFRAWDTKGEGFISGQTALDVFNQSGLDKNELAKIWYVMCSASASSLTRVLTVCDA